MNSKILDLILVSNEYAITQSGVISLGLSDHSLIYCTRKLYRLKYKTSEPVKLRSMNNYNYSTDFKNKLGEIDWKEVYSPDVNYAWSKFKNLFTEAIDLVAPVTHVTQKSKTEPWITQEIIENIREIDEVLIKSRKQISTELYQTYRTLRNKVQRMVTRNSRKK